MQSSEDESDVTTQQLLELEGIDPVWIGPHEISSRSLIADWQQQATEPKSPPSLPPSPEVTTAQTAKETFLIGHNELISLWRGHERTGRLSDLDRRAILLENPYGQPTLSGIIDASPQFDAVVFCGIAGAGKTTYINHVMRRLSQNPNNAVSFISIENARSSAETQYGKKLPEWGDDPHPWDVMDRTFRSNLKSTRSKKRFRDGRRHLVIVDAGNGRRWPQKPYENLCADTVTGLAQETMADGATLIVRVPGEPGVLRKAAIVREAAQYWEDEDAEDLLKAYNMDFRHIEPYTLYYFHDHHLGTLPDVHDAKIRGFILKEYVTHTGSRTRIMEQQTAMNSEYRELVRRGKIEPLQLPAEAFDGIANDDELWKEYERMKKQYSQNATVEHNYARNVLDLPPELGMTILSPFTGADIPIDLLYLIPEELRAYYQRLAT